MNQGARGDPSCQVREEKVASGQAREQDAASVHGNTGTL